MDFQTKLAEVLMDRQEFSKLNLNSINSEQILPQSVFFAHCGAEKACVKKTLTSLIPALFTVVPEKEIINRYQVIVRSLDPLTSRVLLDSLSILIEEERVRTIQSTITQQISLTDELIATKKKELDEEAIKNFSLIIQKKPTYS